MQRDAEDYVLTKFILRVENEKLIIEARRIKGLKQELDRTIGFIAQRAKKMALQKEVNTLKAEFLEFEEVMDCFKQEQNIQEVNPLVHISYLVFGCIGYLASFLIIFHTTLYNLKRNGRPISYLLNNAFEWFTQTFAQLISLALWLIMSFYMLVCIIKGNMMFGKLLSQFFGVHPFKANGTWMSSFLVNSFLMLIASLGLISFLTLEFESFLRFTACEVIFKHLLTNAATIKYMYAYDLTELGMVVVFVCVTCYLLSIPSKKSKIAKIMQQKKKERMEQNREQDES
jgi:hypothetical protein